MGMSQLINEASNLVATFREKDKAINAALAAAVKSAPSLNRSYFVDAVAGNDKGPGSNTEPFQTLKRAIDAIPYGGGGYIYLQGGQEFMLDSTINQGFRNVTILRRGDGDKPVLRNICYESPHPDGGGNVDNMTTGFNLDSGALVLGNLRIRTANYSKPDSTKNIIYTGFIRRYDRPGGRVHLSNCDIELGDTPFLRQTINAQITTLSLYLNRITRVGPKVKNASLVDCGGAPLIFSAAGTTMPAGSQWLGDLLKGYTADSNGKPSSLLTNLVF
ncbi:hypothetical protein [Pseudomonas sp. TCU-HL1]|uniref:hypothetical protein n=1 Tax=Pseudomonas sp. TCU-HL1 TaxID=1856685 RepID=UPI00083E015B|nr:hypothetical protein [Pseudomonas sp. TCU-HL1]AOE85833.1 hypothetical protein THL1_3285 [Pseudomonas sp. TCU-HL1]